MVSGFTGAEKMSEIFRASPRAPTDSDRTRESNREAGETMTFQGSTEDELRQQLREAWRQIGELQWQLQAEQRNSKRQDRLLASQEVTFAQSRNEHEQALADRDQDFADLEDEHQGIVSALEKERGDDAQRARAQPPAVSQLHSGSERSGLMALADVLQGSALQSHNSERTAELQKWERFVRIALDVEDHLDGRPAGALDLEAILRRVVRVQEGTCAGSCGVQVSLERGISPHQAILCAWLVDCWLTHACEPSSRDRSPTVCVTVSSVETPPEIRMSLSLSDVLSAPAPKLWREPLQAVVTALQGGFHDETSSGITVAFPGMLRV
jgi:hypothetical protein